MSSPLKGIPLSHLVEVNPKDFPACNPVPYVGMEDVSEDGRLLRIGPRDRGAISPGQPTFSDGDILFAKITPCMENGKGALVSGLGGRVAQGSTEFHVLRARRGAHPNFVYQWTRTPLLRRAAAAMMTGSAGQRRVPSEFFAKFEVPGFSLEEQRRIAEILDALDAQISTTRACVEKYRVMRYGQVRDIMKDELAALAAVEVSEVVRRAASGNVPLRILDDLIVGIDAGSSPSVDDVPAGPGEWGVLKVSAIGRGVFRPKENKVARDKSLHVASYCVSDGDLLISRANTPELVGLACIVQNTPPHLMLSDKTLRLHLNGDLVSCEYVNLMLGVAEVRRQIEIAATGTSGSMKNISQESIRKLAIPWADQEKQDLVVRMDAAYLEQIEALNRQIGALEQLKQGLAEDLLTGRVRVPEAEAVVESL